MYGDVIMEIDWSVGEILNALSDNDLDDNTVVIFTSDNGPWLNYGNHAGSAFPLREGKGPCGKEGQGCHVLSAGPVGLQQVLFLINWQQQLIFCLQLHPLPVQLCCKSDRWSEYSIDSRR